MRTPGRSASRTARARVRLSGLGVWSGITEDRRGGRFGRVEPVVAVAGEVITDLVPAGEDGVFRAAPGGSPANVAVGLARLGVPARMLARIADDMLGRRLRDHLAANDVDLTH